MNQLLFPIPNSQFRSLSAVFVAFSEVLAAEGVAGLYKGFLPTLLRDVPEIVLQVPNTPPPKTQTPIP